VIGGVDEMTRHIVLLCGVLGLSAIGSPAMAGCDPLGEHCWDRAHRVIYHKENHIAFLEANPDADDGYKGPVITHLRRKILHIRAAIGERWPHWPTPCCYSRRPIYLR
jgi:hypothetical protein